MSSTTSSMERFTVRENLDGDREAWEVYDRLNYEVPEPMEETCNLSLPEADAMARRLNADPVLADEWRSSQVSFDDMARGLATGRE